MHGIIDACLTIYVIQMELLVNKGEGRHKSNPGGEGDQRWDRGNEFVEKCEANPIDYGERERERERESGGSTHQAVAVISCLCIIKLSLSDDCFCGLPLTASDGSRTAPPLPSLSPHPFHEID